MNTTVYANNPQASKLFNASFRMLISANKMLNGGTSSLQKRAAILKQFARDYYINGLLAQERYGMGDYSWIE